MPSDRTRTSDDLRQRYKAVVMQQGRVILDRDFNALQDIVNGQIAADALDEIGPCGSPDDGFTISLPATGPSASFSLSFSAPNPWDFLIAPGTMYVGGQRVVLPPPPSGQPLWSYFHQPDWIDPAAPAAFHQASQSTPPSEYVYLHVFEQEVGAVEDSDLLDVALGGPDTTQRVRLMWRVRRLPVDANDCATALTQAQADWSAEGFHFDSATMRLLPQAALQVSFAAAPATSNPCDPIVQGGYLGAENQLIRLQIGAPLNGQPQLLWGYDDASFLYRVSPTSDGQSLQLSQVPVDAFHTPQTGQVVEVLRTAAILGTAPDATDPTGQRTLVRCVAEARGFVTSVSAYNNSNNTVTLIPPPPARYLNDPNPVFLRIWQGQQPIDLSSQPMTLTDPTTQTSPGIQVAITVPAGGPTGAVLPVGAFWMIAVRPSTPQAVYPERFLTGPQPPDGPRQWVCPLAVIEWAREDFASVPSSSGPAGTIIHCRQRFCNLVSVCNRLSGCCTITVRPSDSSQLQTILDQAVGKGQAVTVCFLPGTYALPQPLRLSSRHAGLVLEACQGGVTIQADPNATLGPFEDGLVVLVGVDRVTLRGLTFIPTPVPITPPSSLLTDLDVSSLKGYRFLAMIGLRPVDCRELTVADCRVEFPSLTPPRGEFVFAVGLFAAGDCTGVEVRGCRFTSQTSPILTQISTSSDSTNLAAVRRPVGPLVALFGVLSLQGVIRGSSDFGIIRYATLDGASFRDNSFHNLTIPIVANAVLGDVRVQDNRVTDCLCGFWLSGYGSLSSQIPDATVMLNLATGFWEILLSLDLGPIYPLPQDYTAADLPRAVLLTQAVEAAPAASIPAGATAPKAGFVVLAAPATAASIPPGATPSSVDTLPLALRLMDLNVVSSAAQTAPNRVSLIILNNDIEALPSTPNVFGSAALLIIVNQASKDANQSLYNNSLIIASNNVHGRLPVPGIPVAGLLISGPTAVTGNLVVSENSLDDRAWSLVIYTLGKENSELLAVTGNVLVGRTNLGALIRFVDQQPVMTNWRVWNTLTDLPGI